LSTAPAAVVSMAVLSVGGIPAALAICGRSWRGVLLAPLAGSVTAALAACGCLAIRGGVVEWFVALSLLGWALLGGLLTARRRSMARGPSGTSASPVSSSGSSRSSRSSRYLAALAAVAGLAVAGWSLSALRAPWVGFDARGIWMLHAVWFAAGHTASLRALRSTGMPFAHPSYPPLIGGSVAVAWEITRDHAYRLGVVLVACLNATAALALGWAMFEVARRAATIRHHRGAVGVLWAGAVVSGLMVLAAFGVAGPFATNGYADMLWSAAAAGAVLYGLVLGSDASDLGAAAILLAVAGLTKDEGIAVGLCIVALMTLRRLAARRPWLKQLAAGAVAAAGLSAWPVLIRILGVEPNVSNIGARQGDDLQRARLTFDAMVPHLHVLLLALPVALVGAALAVRARDDTSLGNDAWSWAAITLGTAVIASVYVTGPGNVEFWLVTSVHRTTMFTALALWCEVGAWTIIVATAIAEPARVIDHVRSSSVPELEIAVSSNRS